MKEFFKVQTSQEVQAVIREFPRVPAEEVSIADAVGRILAEPVTSIEDIPPFDRSTMDGYAVRAKDTFGAAESMPSLMTVVGRVMMGEVPTRPLSEGQVQEITTGGMQPPGADAVVMQEYTQRPDEETVEVMKAVAPGEHVIFKGEDFKSGEEILPRGRKLRPQDIGILAAIGRRKVPVYGKPRVAIISTGDEVVPMEDTPPPGKIRDINAFALWAASLANGAVPTYLGIVPDRFEDLRARCAEGMEEADVILVSGGSSVGNRDFTAAVFESFPESRILVHGISVSPGKPTILARLGQKSLWGLPGHPASSLIIFWLFVRPLLLHIGGLEPESLQRPQTIQARLVRNVPSAQGREDYVRVKLKAREDGFVAVPVFGKSGLISSMTKADGVVRIDLNTEGLDANTLVDVYLLE